jgi:hypothetical protein
MISKSVLSCLVAAGVVVSSPLFASTTSSSTSWTTELCQSVSDMATRNSNLCSSLSRMLKDHNCTNTTPSGCSSTSGSSTTNSTIDCSKEINGYNSDIEANPWMKSSSNCTTLEESLKAMNCSSTDIPECSAS